jgi:hypothetical protein
VSQFALEDCYVGDRSTWSFRIYDDGLDNDLASATVVLDMWPISSSGAAGTIKISDGSCSVEPGITFTGATDDKLTAVAHGLKDGWECVVSNSGGALPTGLAASTRYFVCDATPNTFKLSLEPNGQRIDITGAGTGTNTLKAKGHCTYVPAAIDVDTSGTFKILLTRTISSKAVTFPNVKDGISLTIHAVP